LDLALKVMPIFFYKIPDEPDVKFESALKISLHSGDKIFKTSPTKYPFYAELTPDSSIKQLIDQHLLIEMSPCQILEEIKTHIREDENSGNNKCNHRSLLFEFISNYVI